MNKLRSIFSLLLCLSMVVACKKSNSHTNSCRITAVYDTLSLPSGTEISSTRIFYDNDGRIAYTQFNTLNDSSTRVFIYSDSAIVITPTNSNSPTDTVLLDGKGQAVRVKQAFPANDYYTLFTWTYDASGLVESNGFLQSTTSGPVTDSTNTTYKFVNGDCISSASSDGTVTNYTYYTDKEAADGDYQRFSELSRYGVIITRNKHLIRSAQSGTYVSEYSYTFDKAGKITSAAYRYGNLVFKNTYEYDCSQ